MLNSPLKNPGEFPDRRLSNPVGWFVVIVVGPNRNKRKPSDRIMTSTVIKMDALSLKNVGAVALEY